MWYMKDYDFERPDTDYPGCDLYEEPDFGDELDDDWEEVLLDDDETLDE
jgi:hypothetical protein